MQLCDSRTELGTGSPLSDSKNDVSTEPDMEELKKLYNSARSEPERRAVGLRAIDEGAIRQGAPVSNIDRIFGSNFASDLPASKDTHQRQWILFADQPKILPSQRGVQPATAYVGWYLRFEYDSDARIQSYFLSNLHKGLSVPPAGISPTPVSELRRQYQAAKSEQQRRDVCLRAIDEGVIQTFSPTNVSTLDSIFGTRLAFELPKKKQDSRTARIDFAPTESGSVTQPVWHLVVEYYRDGSIADYYLTN